MNVDEVFAQIGELGLQQWKYNLVIAFIHSYFPLHMLSYTFVGRTLDFDCVFYNGETEKNETKIVTGDPDECPAECLDYVFDPVESSLVSEWDLVCERQVLRVLLYSTTTLPILLFYFINDLHCL